MGQLQLSVSSGTFNTFLKLLVLGSIRDVDENRQLIEIYCPNAFVRDTVEQRFWGQIKTILDSITEKKNELVFTVKAITTETTIKKALDKENSQPSLIFEEKTITNGKAERIRKAGLREFFTFENFAVSGSNQMAHAAAIAVSDNPGSAYNPLFLWGGVGVGKTHLMQAIGSKLLMREEAIKVVYCSGEEFTNDIVEGIKTKSMEKVREKYRKVQLLLLDDIQFIAGKETVQEEFFHTFNAIQKVGGQVVLTSDRQPHEIAKLEDRLRSRFEAGLIVDISPPDFALRSAITLIKAEQKGIMISTDIAQVIAQSAESARKIEGVLMKLLTIKNIKGQEITMETIKGILEIKDDLSQNQARIVTPNSILDLVADNFGITVSQLKGSRRTTHVVLPRMIAMYLMRADLKFPFEEIGRVLGGRDHSTVMHAVNKMETAVISDDKLRHQVGVIRKKIFGENVDKLIN